MISAMEIVDFNAVTFTTLIVAVALLESAFANSENISESKPHFLYMKRLRQHLADSLIALPDTVDQDTTDQGQLVATSIETLTTSGEGYRENGYFFEDGIDINLLFTIPSQVGDFPDVQLWMFPDKSHITERKILDISIHSSALLTGTKNRRTDQFRVLWDTDEDCIALNLTILSKRIYKLLQKKNLDKSNVSVELEIGAVIERSEIQEDLVRALNQDLCSSMAHRETNDSFLVVKNYNEETVPRLMRDSGTHAGRRKRQISEVGNEPQEVDQDSNNSTEAIARSCELVPLIVNFTELYGSFVLEPTVADIRDCRGKCTDEKVFSKHGKIKERLKLLPGREYLSRFEPFCTAIQYRPLHLLIALEDKSGVIVQMSELVADKCACQ